MKRPILYHSLWSFNSQIVRLALIEKGVSWRNRLVDPERDHRALLPSYLHLNSHGTVPTFSHRTIVLNEPVTIALYINNNFPGPMLVPGEPKARQLMEQWITLQHQFPDRELTFSGLSGLRKRLVKRHLEKRKKRLRKYEIQHEELAAVYKTLYEETLDQLALIDDQEARRQAVSRLEPMLDMLEETVKRSTWLAGEEYSLADIVWTAALARLDQLGLSELWKHSRPNLAGYFDRVKKRPSFRKAKLAKHPGTRLLIRDVFRSYGWLRGLFWGLVILAAISLAWTYREPLLFLATWLPSALPAP